MLIGYARISKVDGSQSLDLQRDALREEPDAPTLLRNIFYRSSTVTSTVPSTNGWTSSTTT